MKSAYRPVDAEKLVGKYPGVSREFTLELAEIGVQANMLKTRVRAEPVGNVVAFFATDPTPTTGA